MMSEQTVADVLGDNTALLERCSQEFKEATIPLNSAMLSAIKKAVKNSNNEDLSDLYLQLAVC